MKIAVVGAGAMGRWSVKALGLSPDVGEIVVGDYDEGRPREVAQAMGAARRPRSSSTLATPRASARLSRGATRWSTPPSTSGTST